MRRLTLISILLVATLVAPAFTSFAQDDLLNKVAQLQETARQANGGALGCGFGEVTLITSTGTRTEDADLDPIHVFGQVIKVSDLIRLLESRAESDQTGASGPMSGQVDDLCYVILYTLSLAKDPASVKVISKLLRDKSDVVRGWAAIALYRMGNSSEELRSRVQKIAFPKAAIQSATARGAKPPSWAASEDK